MVPSAKTRRTFPHKAHAKLTWLNEKEDLPNKSSDHDQPSMSARGIEITFQRLTKTLHSTRQ